MQWICGGGRVFACRVVLLDEREQFHEVQANKSGQALLDAVFRQLDLVETSYFGLRYMDQDNQPRWLEARRRLSRQLHGDGPHTLYLAVKFYAADPCRLLEEITRYQVFLQVRQDVVRGRLPVPPDLAPQLAAYVLQSELGDYDPRRHPPGYVSEFRIQPGQTPALEAKAAELHRALAGQTPAAAELGYLDRAKWLELYGADLHPVLGEDSVEYFLGLAPSGVLVLRNKRAVASYYWPRITKLYSKGKYFMLRVTDKNNEVSTYGFETPSRGACRHLWRCCSEQHAFFRLQPSPQHNRSIRQNGRSPPAFTRVPSRRLQRRAPDSSLQISTLEVRDPSDIKPISIPQPALSLESPYRSTCSIPAALGSIRRPDSPRSTRSAPFPRPPQRQGLYSGPPSPRNQGANNSTRLRSSSIDSHSSNDSRSCRRHRQRSRRTSDAESEVSRGSGRSRRRRRHRSRHKSRGDSAEETDSKHRSSSRKKEYELIESGGQWKEVQRKQATGGGGAVQQASVRRAAAAPESIDSSQSQHRSSHRHRRHRKHRSRSRSPSETKSWLPTELKQHLEWELVDTEGMSVDQLKEIPYTVVQTSRARQLKLKAGSKLRNGEIVNNNEDLNKNYSIKPNTTDMTNCNGGSIRSASSTVSSGRNSNSKITERRSKDAISREINSASSASAITRSTRGVNVSDVTGASRTTASASNSSSGELISSVRVSHEHTDSGLGADQDYAYSSERSSDSAKCPVAGGSRPQGSNAASVSTVSLRPNAPYPLTLSADLASLSLTQSRRKPPINPGVNKQCIGSQQTGGAARIGRGRAGGSLRSLASVQSEGRATLHKHRGPGPLYYVRGDPAYAFNRHASNNNFVDSGIFLTNSRQNGGSLRGSTSHHADLYNMNRIANQGHSTLTRYTDANANVKRYGDHRTDNSLHIILKPLIESTQLQGN